MGVSSSKQNANGATHIIPSSSSEAADVVQRSRSTRSLVFKSSCLRSQHSDNDDEPQVPDCPCEENGNIVSCSSENKSSSCRVSEKCYRTDEAEQSDDLNCITSDTELDEWGESSFTARVSRDGNTSSRNLASQPQNTPSGFLSRFSFYPGNLSFRLNRANSLGSARARSLSSRSYSVSNGEVEHAIPSSTLVNRDDRPQGCDFFPACFTNRSPRIPTENAGYNNLQCSHSRPDFSNNSQDNAQINSNHGVLRNRNDNRIDYSTNLFSPINHSDSDDGGRRHANRRFSAREPADRNVRFSRTLSVGRLRDRVLRRTSVPDMDLYHFQEDREVRHTNRGSGRQSLRHAPTEATSEDYNFTPIVSSDNISSSISSSSYGSQNHAHQTSRSRETRYRDLLEHRSNFLDRRRRIRSQVRALQRLGSRFENLSGHERSCILSGQHRAGHCTCRSAAREANSNEDATARASISRIVMLAEALFEVLDEIHQQSVVLSSRPSVSSIGSIPAPNEVVESLPLRTFSKLKRKPSDEAAQCYICLVDYEEGDSMRILPCHHEFHRSCVDKWLKEIHRVCPLCRGDICRPESLTAGS